MNMSVGSSQSSITITSNNPATQTNNIMKCILAILATAAVVFASSNGTDPVVNEGQTVQDLRKPCDCPQSNCPPFLTEKAVSEAFAGLLVLTSQKCECESNHAVYCFKKSNRGCPEPIIVVSIVFTTITTLTGKSLADARSR